MWLLSQHLHLLETTQRELLCFSLECLKEQINNVNKPALNNSRRAEWSEQLQCLKAFSTRANKVFLKFSTALRHLVVKCCCNIINNYSVMPLKVCSLIIILINNNLSGHLFKIMFQLPIQDRCIQSIIGLLHKHVECIQIILLPFNR